MSKRVSIIFSTYNSSDYVVKCLKSCLCQNYEDLFVIVADDGSTDDTIDKMNEAAKASQELEEETEQKQTGMMQM